MGRLFVLMFTAWSAVTAQQAVAAGHGSAKKPRKVEAEKTEPTFERVGGTFLVKSIQHLNDGGFKVTFVANEGQPRFKTLVLESSHVHLAVVEGATLRLSADVISQKNNTAEVGQMVLFVPGRVGETPVWMLSRRTTTPHPPERLLKMHAPSNDYQVF